MILTAHDVVFPEKRKKNTNKYDYGSLLIVGGSPGMMGAPQLAALAAFKVGTGLVSIALKKSEAIFFHPFFPEVMTPLYDKVDFNELLKHKTAILFGPGIREDDKVAEKFFNRLCERDIPMVIDAGGLPFLKRRRNAGKKIPIVIITPHSGEASAFFAPANDIKKAAIELATNELVIVIKNSYTNIYSLHSMLKADLGNPGMATAGSGDVLAGMIAGLLAQGKDAKSAAVNGVLWHQLCGKSAARKWGESAMMASDIINEIPLIELSSHE